MDSPKSKFKTLEIFLLSLAHFVHDVYTAFLSPLLPLLMDKLSLSLTRGGSLAAVMQLPSLINPLLGLLADRVNLKYFVVFAPAFTAIFMSLIGLAPNYLILLFMLFMAGISVAVFHVPAPVLIARMAGSRKGLAMSFFMVGGELARTVGPIIAVTLVAMRGLDGFWPIMFAGIATSGILFWRLRNVDLSIHKSTKNLALSRTFINLKHIFLPLAGIIAARSFMHGVLTTFLPTYIKTQSGNLWLAGLALSVLEAAGVVGVLIAGPLSDFLGRQKTLAISLIGAPVFILLFLESSGIWQFLALIGCGATLLSTTPVMLALVQEHAKESPATANGIFMMLSFVFRSSIVIFIGFLADRLGLHTTYFISALVGMLGIPFLFFLPKKSN
ncbi:major facilitator superfamily MFS_1 [Thermodesulfatator indicus DSM 15286]|uniref:Major facilitator superfamily MFS_1 n=1 Tax=Thermodesulfatator indicus (strain DSM 15286 / JCM 11887 / CIR29812) TaxID=667014 RepID=F8AB85_THEID|nr:MFS transporter [Thermodesulfatator indicus]AEH45542.1 major facilitator superfamily MFS_1 [Thermodesulfatator indicus DSM 15286]